MRKTLAVLILAALLVGGATQAAEPDLRVRVRHIYDGCGTLCYLGALAMATQDDSLPYLKVVRYTNPALVQNGEHVLGKALGNLGYTVQVSGANPIRVQEFVKMMLPGATAGQMLADKDAAVKMLHALLKEGKAPMVPVEQSALWEDRVAAFRRAGVPVPPNPGQGPHYLVVTGYDGTHYFVNDTAWSSSKVGLDMPVRKAAFMKAWGEEGNVLMTTRKVKEPVAEADVLKQVLRSARSSVEELDGLRRRLASTPGDLKQFDFLTLAAGAYRRQVLSEWLKEAGHQDAAKVYRAAIPYYERIRPNLSNAATARIVARIHEIEKQAASLLPAPARGAE